MDRRYLVSITLAILLLTAGCTNRVGVEHSDDPVARSDNGVEVANLEVLSEGQRDCYHTLEANVTNTNNQTIHDVRIKISISDENGQILSTFTTGYVKMDSGETKELEVQHGPHKNQCWFSGDAADYHVNVTYKTN